MPGLERKSGYYDELPKPGTYTAVVIVTNKMFGIIGQKVTSDISMVQQAP